MISKEARLKQFEIYATYCKEFEEKFTKKGITPKNHEWRPYRWCSRDIVFANLKVRHERSRNCLEVDVCLMANPPQYYDNSGPRVAMGFLLSEAYKCGTSMEIVFTKNVETRIENGVEKGRVPAYIYDLACELGIKLNHVLEGHITPFEARQIYLELAGFSDEAKEKVMKLSVDDLLTPERACFLVMGGLWSTPEAESIILGCDNPESIMLSDSIPEDRHLYLRDVMAARGTVLGGALDMKLQRKELMEDGQIVESEGEGTDHQISFDKGTYAKSYIAAEDCLVPWTENKELIFRTDEQMVVMVRARSSVEIRVTSAADLESLIKTVEKYRAINPDVKVGILYPRDFEDIPEGEKREIKRRVEEQGAFLMVSPESVAGLDKEAMRRIETGRMVRHE